MNRQKKILLVCCALLVLAIVYALVSGPEKQRVVTDRPAGREVRQKEPAPEERPRVYLELLAPEAGDFPGAERDLFAALFPAPARAPAPPPAPSAPVAPPPPAPERETPSSASPPPPSRPVEPPVRFTYLGFLEADGRRVVFLERDDRIYLAREGETFGDGFRVLELSPDKMVISRGEDGRRQTIPLGPGSETGMSQGGSDFSLPGQQRRQPASLPAGTF